MNSVGIAFSGPIWSENWQKFKVPRIMFLQEEYKLQENSPSFLGPLWTENRKFKKDAFF
jgi:hypothetical protein